MAMKKKILLQDWSKVGHIIYALIWTEWSQAHEWTSKSPCILLSSYVITVALRHTQNVKLLQYHIPEQDWGRDLNGAHRFNNNLFLCKRTVLSSM